ncbi:hypothetical protein J1605_018288 [Eschrichtius robustus]|uniref:Uncharacterized protein n=1 Tax=Eschrichtius robustus TaxID=9764 RepID=A0AB34HSW1_ESCRO|nr:hypothetical protein J1605_018288 [Eschrichtius robustus]
MARWISPRDWCGGDCGFQTEGLHYAKDALPVAPYRGLVGEAMMSVCIASDVNLHHLVKVVATSFHSGSWWQSWRLCRVQGACPAAWVDGCEAQRLSDLPARLRRFRTRIENVDQASFK